MSTVEILPPPSSSLFAIPTRDGDGNHRGIDDIIIGTGASWVSSLGLQAPIHDFSTANGEPGPVTPLSEKKFSDDGEELEIVDEDGNADDEDGEDENIFPDLPPLHHGHPSLHTRARVSSIQHLSTDSHASDLDESAFFTADLSVVLGQLRLWRAHLPTIKPFYAVKCNPDPYVLRLLAASGCGFDCASAGEIKQVLSLFSGGGGEGKKDAAKDRIIFANPCKAASFIRGAKREGVEMMTFDNHDELLKISSLYPRGAKLVLRLLTDDTSSLCRLSAKFGASLRSAKPLLEHAKELGLDVVGVSFHVGSGCRDAGAFMDAVGRAKRVWEWGREVGYEFRLLDVGGGFEDESFVRTARVLREALDEYFPEHKDTKNKIRVIAEPGRFFVSNAFSLACCVIARRGPLPPSLASSSSFQPSQPSLPALPSTPAPTSSISLGAYTQGAKTETGAKLKEELSLSSSAGVDLSVDPDVGAAEEHQSVAATATPLEHGADGEEARIKNDSRKEIKEESGEASASAGPEDEESPKVMYYINDGVYGSFNCILFDHQHPTPTVLSLNSSFHTPTSSSSSSQLIPSSVWGPTCDGIDLVCPLIQLPASLGVGDWLEFHGMGAYTVCAASGFNGFEVSRVVYTSGVDGGEGVGGEVRRVLKAFAKRQRR